MALQISTLKRKKKDLWVLVEGEKGGGKGGEEVTAAHRGVKRCWWGRGAFSPKNNFSIIFIDH